MASGRSGTGHWRYRRNRALLLAASDRCGICGHLGARTCDHIINATLWPRLADGKLAPGFNEQGNLQPAHGTMGSGKSRVHNPCPVCGRLCNQSKGARQQSRPQSRPW